MKLSNLSLALIFSGVLICAAGGVHHLRERDAREAAWRRESAERRLRIEQNTAAINASLARVESTAKELERGAREITMKAEAESREREQRQKLAEAWKWADGPTLRAKAEAELEAARAQSEAALGFTTPAP